MFLGNTSKNLLFLFCLILAASSGICSEKILQEIDSEALRQFFQASPEMQKISMQFSLALREKDLYTKEKLLCEVIEHPELKKSKNGANLFMNSVVHLISVGGKESKIDLMSTWLVHAAKNEYLVDLVKKNERIGKLSVTLVAANLWQGKYTSEENKAILTLMSAVCAYHNNGVREAERLLATREQLKDPRWRENPRWYSLINLYCEKALINFNSMFSANEAFSICTHLMSNMECEQSRQNLFTFFPYSLKSTKFINGGHKFVDAILRAAIETGFLMPILLESKVDVLADNRVVYSLSVIFAEELKKNKRQLSPTKKKCSRKKGAGRNRSAKNNTDAVRIYIRDKFCKEKHAIVKEACNIIERVKVSSSNGIALLDETRQKVKSFYQSYKNKKTPKVTFKLRTLADQITDAVAMLQSLAHMEIQQSKSVEQKQTPPEPREFVSSPGPKVYKAPEPKKQKAKTKGIARQTVVIAEKEQEKEVGKPVFKLDFADKFTELMFETKELCGYPEKTHTLLQLIYNCKGKFSQFKEYITKGYKHEKLRGEQNTWALRVNNGVQQGAIRITYEKNGNLMTQIRVSRHYK
ncbi:MAG: hypothetical protein ACPGXY_05705 [Alphaproteobacteria bacterium]